MTFAKIETRVKQNVEDISGDIFSSTEIADAVNEAKDEVFSIIKGYDSNFPHTSWTGSFTAGVRNLTGPTDFESIVNLRDVTGDRDNLPIRVVPIGEIYKYVNLNELVIALTYDRGTSSWLLVRNNTTDALDVFLDYIPTDVELSSGDTTTDLSYFPKPGENLMIFKATNNLLASRARINQLFSARESKLEVTLKNNLGRKFYSSPRYVHYEDDYWRPYA